jgi:sugar lactone lactonase YvrE
VEIVASGYGLPEGPRVDHDGAVWFCDAFGGGVHRLGADDPAPVVVVPDRKGIGGIVLHADGGVVVSGRDLAHVESSGDSRTLLVVEGVSGFNDITTDRSGRVLAGGLRFFPLRGEEPVPGGVWRVGEGPAELLFEGILWPNGMCFSPDDSILYVSDYADAKVLAWDGHEVSEFARVPDGEPDGLTVDSEGGVWVALGNAGQIARFAPTGELEERLEVPAEFVSSLCLHGDCMWVTAVSEGAGVVLRADAPARGVSVRLARV